MRAITIAHLPSALLFHVCSPGTAVCTACREPGRCVASLLLSQTHMRTYKDTIIFLECSFSHSLTCPETSSTSVWPVRMYLKSRQESGHSSPSGVRGKDPGNLAMVEPQLLSHPRLPSSARPPVSLCHGGATPEGFLARVALACTCSGTLPSVSPHPQCCCSCQRLCQQLCCHETGLGAQWHLALGWSIGTEANLTRGLEQAQQSKVGKYEILLARKVS